MNVAIIVNADDFGISEDVNRAIVRCFEEEVISSASIMANMAGFDHACRLAVEKGLTKRVGIHLNITEGKPLSQRILREPKFVNANGEFCFRRNNHFVLKGKERAALMEELECQIVRCLDMGLSPNHIDSHHHVHTELGVFAVVQCLLNRYGVRVVRAARNDDRRKPALTRLYKAFFNARLSQMGVRRTSYCGDLDGIRRMQEQGKAKAKSCEIMVHPILERDGIVVDSMDGREVIPLIRGMMQGRTLSEYLPRRRKE